MKPQREHATVLSPTVMSECNLGLSAFAMLGTFREIEPLTANCRQGSGRDQVDEGLGDPVPDGWREVALATDGTTGQARAATVADEMA